MIVFHKAVEDADRFVIVFPGDRIELVVVAARAVDGEGLKTLIGGPNDVVQIIEPVVGVFEIAVQYTWPETDETRGCQAFKGGLIQLVAGNLLHDELVIGLVLVEGVDDIVAIAPCFRDVIVVLISRAVGVTGHIQPEPGPPFAVVR